MTPTDNKPCTRCGHDRDNHIEVLGESMCAATTPTERRLPSMCDCKGFAAPVADGWRPASEPPNSERLVLVQCVRGNVRSGYYTHVGVGAWVGIESLQDPVLYWREHPPLHGQPDAQAARIAELDAEVAAQAETLAKVRALAKSNGPFGQAIGPAILALLPASEVDRG